MLRFAVLALLAVSATASPHSYHLQPRTESSSNPFAAAGYSSVPATLPALPYDYDALEPYISEAIMKLHHDKHHVAYVAGFNTAVEKLDEALKSGNLTEVVRLQSALNFNGGGHINHSLFWRTLTPPFSTQSTNFSSPPSSFGSTLAPGPLYDLITREYGSLPALEKIMTAEGLGVQGSGWVWLGWNGEASVLQVETTKNQDLIPEPLVPIIGIDVWEHAYYLDYKNNRTAYLENVWNVVNWEEGEKRLVAAQNGEGW
ncbi:hypothetical protein JCM8547_008437 [Rhodosporidiobolus lusitaniae]